MEKGLEAYRQTPAFPQPQSISKSVKHSSNGLPKSIRQPI
jgi:hypothetical protein